MTRLLWFSLISCLPCVHLFAVNPSDPIVHIAKYKGDKTCAISYTFDDGMTEHYTMAAPQLEKHGFRGTFWINGESINNDHYSVTDTVKTCWPNLKEMALNGHEISNHGWSHKNLVRISLEEAKVEIEKNDSIILEKIGIPSKTFCYAYNAKNDEVLEMASANRVGTRTKEFGVGSVNSKITPEKLDQRVEEFLANEEWGVAMMHGITYGYDHFHDPATLWNHFEKVKAQEDRIWVGTFYEVAAYIGEREATTLNVQKKKNGLIITSSLSLDKELYQMPLTAVVQKEGISKVFVKQGKKKLDAKILSDKVLFDFDPFGAPIQISFK